MPSKKIIISIFVVILIVTIAYFYFSTRESVHVTKNQPTTGLNNTTIKCPPDGYNWLNFQSIPKDGLAIKCQISDTKSLTLETEQPNNQNDNLTYKVYFNKNDDKLLLGTYPVYTIGESQFAVATKQENLMHIYDIQRDMALVKENGWFINTESNKFARYTNNGNSIDIDINNSAYNIKYVIKDADSNRYPNSKSFGKDIVILGLMLNNKQVISFDKPIIAQFDSSDELVPYYIPYMEIVSMNSLLNAITLKINDDKFDIFLNSEK